MSRYIEEKELMEWVQNWFEKNRYYHPYSKSNDIPIPELYDILEQMPSAGLVEIKKEGEWDMFDLISSAYYGKRMYFKQDDGIVYSRYSHKYISVDEAILEFVSLIDGTEESDAKIH